MCYTPSPGNWVRSRCATVCGLCIPQPLQPCSAYIVCVTISQSYHPKRQARCATLNLFTVPQPAQPCSAYIVCVTISRSYHPKRQARCANLSYTSPLERANVLHSFTRQLGEVPLCNCVRALYSATSSTLQRIHCMRHDNACLPLSLPKGKGGPGRSTPQAQ
jgi:hypothetical protein